MVYSIFNLVVTFVYYINFLFILGVPNEDMDPAIVVPGVPNNDLSSKNGVDEHGATLPPNQTSTSLTIGKK